MPQYICCWQRFFVLGIILVGTFAQLTTAEDSSCWIPPVRVSDTPVTSEQFTEYFRNGMPGRPLRIDLAPAQWIWIPSQRALPNMFVLFRREFSTDSLPEKAVGWVTADSRYRLTVNGQRLQWGPAPCDPRQMDVDPIDMTAFVRQGKNVIGIEVLHYGQGDGTWAAGKPGLLFFLQLQYADGRTELIVSDPTWQARLDRAHRPGQYKRWFLRALQEEFDARQHPYGWDSLDFQVDSQWVAAASIGKLADRPSGCANFPGNDLLDSLNVNDSSLRLREIPLLKETLIPPKTSVESGIVRWQRDPDDWFDLRMPGCFTIQSKPIAEKIDAQTWTLPAAADDRQAAFLLFEWDEQIVGCPCFEIDAPEGTIIELMQQEAHDPKATPWLDTQFFSWSRFICREGVNRFETFDFESLRWLQLHVRGNTRAVTIRNVAVRRRLFDWKHEPVIRCGEPALQRLFDAAINTVYNSAQETIVDGMARERQQYSGDGSHQLHAIRGALGEPGISRRFLRTFSEGITPDGYFLDCWPACDRLYRVLQKQIGAAFWGPLLDHGVGFCFDNWNHYMETGDLAATDESYPRLLRFADYLDSLREEDGLIPVEDLGIPTVWIDHTAFTKQRHKKCAFNLYTSAMLLRALAPLARSRGETDIAVKLEKRGRNLLDRCVEQFWDKELRLFVANRPWLDEEKSARTDDRSLAMSIYYDLCPNQDTEAALNSLVSCPPEMGFSYPCNACWRYWGLAKGGRADVVLNELRTKWATMPSVILNNTIAEDWTSPPDSCAQWSHCAVSPVYCLFMDIVGIRPTSPGFTTCEIRPQLGDLKDLEIVYHTPQGPIRFAAKGDDYGHELTITPPSGCQAMLILPEKDPIRLVPGTTFSGQVSK